MNRVLRTGLLALVFATGCSEELVIADADGQAIVYGVAARDGGGGAPGALIDVVVYRLRPCGDAYGAVSFQTETDATGAYRIHLEVLTNDAFVGCVEVVAADTALGLTSDTATREQVPFRIAPPFDSVRIDLHLQ